MSNPDDFMKRHWYAIEAGNYDLLRELLQPDCKLVVVPGDHVQARLVPEFAAAAMAFLG